MTVDYQVGDSLELMRAMPDASIDLSACSPPFLALRNYNDLDGQWGSEPTPAAFLSNLLTLAVETRRVLAPHGSIAWELGDTYSGSGNGPDNKIIDGSRDGWSRRQPSTGWPLAKSLCGIPTLFAWSLAYGRNLLDPTQTFEPWRVRNVIVWSRSNPPVGALGDKVRPATSYITVATPSAKRWFDLDAVRTEPNPAHRRPSALHRNDIPGRSNQVMNPIGDDGMRITSNAAGAPPTDYWTDEHPSPEHDATDLAWLVNGQPSKLAHYAMWPPKIAERLVLSMCPAEVCRTCGEPRRRLTERPAGSVERNLAIRGGRSRDGAETGPRPSGFQRVDNITVGWSDCGHDDYRPGVVLDPFAGTGTTLAVANVHGRDAVGFDLDPHNPTLYEARHAEVKKALFGTKPEIPGSLSLFEEAS